MSDIKKYEPLWGEWYVDSLVGQGSFSKVYKIRRETVDTIHYAAAKFISILHDESDIQMMKKEGFDDDAMREFLEAFARNITFEIDLMREFSGNNYIVSFEDYQIIDKAAPPESPLPSSPIASCNRAAPNIPLHSGRLPMGLDILIRMELLTSLANVVAGRALSQAEVIQLGIHICRALELCAQKKIIHRNIKPGNIFVSSDGGYKLGDFGIARQIEQTSSGLSKKGTNTYMAPEVFKFESYGSGADIYSLGMVMYSLLNQNRVPFLPTYPQAIMPADKDAALRRRMRGDDIPALRGVRPELNSLVLKACAYSREDRFSGPAQMRERLEEMEGTVA